MKPSPHPAHSKQQQGAIALMLVAMIMLAVTTAIITALPPDQQRSALQQNTQIELAEASQAVFGYGLRPQINGANEPLSLGTLPCPDNDGDGISDVLMSQCITARGWLPYRTLGLSRYRDSNGHVLWYAINPNFGATNTTPKDLTDATLTLDGTPVAAIIIAPGAALTLPFLTQQRRDSHNAANVNHYLEGRNAQANPTQFETRQDDEHNDQLHGIPLTSFRTAVENASSLP